MKAVLCLLVIGVAYAAAYGRQYYDYTNFNRERRDLRENQNAVREQNNNVRENSINAREGHKCFREGRVFLGGLIQNGAEDSYVICGNGVYIPIKPEPVVNETKVLYYTVPVAPVLSKPLVLKA